MIITVHVFTEKFSFYICWKIFIIIYCQNIEKRKSNRGWKLYRGRARGEAAANMTQRILPRWLQGWYLREKANCRDCGRKMLNSVLNMFIWTVSRAIKKKVSKLVGNTETGFGTEDNSRDSDKETSCSELIVKAMKRNTFYKGKQEKAENWTETISW